jgi:type II secretory pathway pseudopilin PulG
VRQRYREAAAGATLPRTILIFMAIGVAAAFLVPLILDYLEDTRKAQAQLYASVLANGITQFHKDTLKFPYMADPNDTARSLAWQPGDCRFLTSANGNCPRDHEIPWGIDASDGLDCTGVGRDSDTLENHLVTNQPGGKGRYPTTGRSPWRGPYVDPGLVDPWGNKYLVNIRQADPTLGNKAVFVLSAGPNGIIETAFDQDAAGFTVGGDDIAARVK